MGAVEDWIAKSEGQAAAQRASAAGSGFSGFVNSALSSLPEMFGQNPTEAATEYRSAHPLLGFASTMVPTIGTYGAVAKASEAIPAFANLLEGTMARTGLSAVENPIAYGAVKEAARYAPFELARLGIGLATAPSDNYGNLFADVGLSELLAGGFGGIGGYFRTGGKAVPQTGRVVGADLGFKPAFELRMSLDPEAQVTGDVPLSEVQQSLVRRGLTETPAESTAKGYNARYVDKLEGGTPESAALINSIFRSKGPESKQGLTRQLLVENNANPRTLNEGELQGVLGGAGFSDVTDLASTAVYPRLVSVKSDRMAGWLGKAFDEASGFNAVSDGVLMGREANDGLFVIGKRLRAGSVDGALDAKPGADGVTPGSKSFGSTRAANGDQWLFFKTDQPQRFVPEAAKVAELNFSRFSKYEDSFKVGRAIDPFNQNADAILNAVTPGDYRDITKIGKQSWITKMSGKLASNFGEVTGLKDSATARATAEWLWDVGAPTAFKENRNPLYGRLWMMLQGGMKYGDGQVSKLMGGDVHLTGKSPLRALAGGIAHGEGFAGNEPARAIWQRIWDRSRGEYEAVVNAARTQTPAESLEKLSADGLVSAETKADYQALQKIDEDFHNQLFLPSLENAGLGGQFEPLKGYLLPRVFRGDWYVKVADERGAEQWLATGKNAAAAKKEAAAVVAEAESRGAKWTAGEGVMHGSEIGADPLQEISDMVSRKMAGSADSQDIVQAALRKLSAQRSSGARISKPGSTMNTFAERTGRAGSPDREVPDVKKVIEDVTNHYRQLGRFAAYHTWNQRWAPLANNLSKQNPTMYQDLLNKANQYMGKEGRLTKALNDTLKPVLGHALGPKAATRIASGTNALMYAWNIGIANPTFALLNVLQPLQTVAPMLAMALSAPSERVAQMMQFVPKYGADGRAAGVMSFLHPMKVLGQATRMGAKPTPDELEAIQRAMTEGVLNAQVHEDWIGEGSKAARTLGDSYRAGGAWEFIKHASTYMADKSETYSRMIAFNAFHILGRDHFGLEGDQLFRFAERGTRMSMYSYSVVDRSRMFTGPVGSMFGLFKNWQFHFIGQMGQYAGMALKGEAFAPLIWQGASALALGGIGATPLVMAADGLAKWNSDSPDSYTWMKDNWHNAADEIYFGLPAFLGMSLQASSTMPGTDVRNDISNLSNFVFIERAKAAGKAIGHAWQLGTSADENALRDPNVRDQLIGAFLPRAIFKAVSAAEGNYVKSMATGYPQERDVSGAARMFTALGFNTVEIEAQQRVANKLYQDQQATRTAVQTIGEAYAHAAQAGNSDEMDRLITRSLGMNLPISSVMQSAATRMRRETQGDSMSRYKGEKAASYIGALKD